MPFGFVYTRSTHRLHHNCHNWLISAKLAIVVHLKGESHPHSQMELLKRLLVEEEGQGLVEYTLIVVLVALVFWVAIKNTNIGSGLAAGWSKITDCVSTPSACDSAS
jgi:Flp pilus assembly pilin Flp